MAIMTKSFRQRLAEIFGFDLRSLALFRIALALVVLVDLSVRFSQVTAHYSELGVLPLEILSKVSASPFYWSIFHDRHLGANRLFTSSQPPVTICRR